MIWPLLLEPVGLLQYLNGLCIHGKAELPDSGIGAPSALPNYLNPCSMLETGLGVYLSTTYIREKVSYIFDIHLSTYTICFLFKSNTSLVAYPFFTLRASVLLRDFMPNKRAVCLYPISPSACLTVDLTTAGIMR